MSHVPGDSHGCQMDGRTISTNIGGGRAIITLQAADRDRGRWWNSGYERRVTCIRMRVIRMVIRASCHHEVHGTCSQEGGPYSLAFPLQFLPCKLSVPAPLNKTRIALVMSQNVEISRANWTDPIQRKHFIDLCLQEANKGFRSGGGLKSSAWPRISKELEKLLGKRHGYNSKYPEAKQFRFKPLANVEELEALFGGVLATGSKNWSSGGVIASEAEESSTHSTSMPSETSISLEEDENFPRNTNDEAEGSKKKQRKERNSKLKDK
ncbi:hypothetical protein CK203_047442 [Vitis vinifera]|uniref:Myb/SANT-like domain-containing protein n=1 Tax=Vitis vinifera TaxID=29760 RepID=A0A438H678_VITVI|nr:hypothetical protein CK203_047442 [Vitis vinifera]